MIVVICNCLSHFEVFWSYLPTELPYAFHHTCTTNASIKVALGGVLPNLSFTKGTMMQRGARNRQKPKYCVVDCLCTILVMSNKHNKINITKLMINLISSRFVKMQHQQCHEKSNNRDQVCMKRFQVCSEVRRFLFVDSYTIVNTGVDFSHLHQILLRTVEAFISQTSCSLMTEQHTNWVKMQKGYFYWVQYRTGSHVVVFTSGYLGWILHKRLQNIIQHGYCIKTV